MGCTESKDEEPRRPDTPIQRKERRASMSPLRNILAGATPQRTSGRTSPSSPGTSSPWRSNSGSQPTLHSNHRSLVPVEGNHLSRVPDRDDSADDGPPAMASKNTEAPQTTNFSTSTNSQFLTREMVEKGRTIRNIEVPSLQLKDDPQSEVVRLSSYRIWEISSYVDDVIRDIIREDLESMDAGVQPIFHQAFVSKELAEDMEMSGTFKERKHSTGLSVSSSHGGNVASGSATPNPLSRRTSVSATLDRSVSMGASPVTNSEHSSPAFPVNAILPAALTTSLGFVDPQKPTLRHVIDFGNASLDVPLGQCCLRPGEAPNEPVCSEIMRSPTRQSSSSDIAQRRFQKIVKSISMSKGAMNQSNLVSSSEAHRRARLAATRDVAVAAQKLATEGEAAGAAVGVESVDGTYGLCEPHAHVPPAKPFETFDVQPLTMRWIVGPVSHGQLLREQSTRYLCDTVRSFIM